MQNGQIGLLAPNDAKGSGAGFVSYSAVPKVGLPTGTPISAEARVLFDHAPPEDTNTITQQVDGQAPVTTLAAQPLGAGSDDYLVEWTASDDASGVKHVTVYVAEDGGDFKIWLRQSNETSAVYRGQAGHDYEFLALATDNAGNREQPPFGVAAPDDGSRVNLGIAPDVGQTQAPQLLPLPDPSPTPSTNRLFVAAQQAIPSETPAFRLSEFETVLRPFTAESFATGIRQSHADIGPMAITVFEDETVLISGGSGRNQLYRVSPEGGYVGSPLAYVDHPIFDMQQDSDGRLWATTGGGPLLELDPDTGLVLGEYGDRITQSLAIHPESGLIYVSTGDGIAIFDPQTTEFAAYSKLRVGNLRFAPDGSLWAALWPERGAVVRFNQDDEPQLMLQFDTPVDSLAFGLPGTHLENLLFVSHNAGADPEDGSDLTMVDLATLETIAVAKGGTRGDILVTTPDGRLLVSQSNQVDVLSPILAPAVAFTNPAADSVVALPLGSVSVTFDHDMDVGDKTEPGSVLNPDNYQLRGATAGNVPIPIRSVIYDAEGRTAILTFESLPAEPFELTVRSTVESRQGLSMEADYVSTFLAISDFTPFVNIEFTNSRMHRVDQTVSYDVTLTNIGDYQLQVPLYLLLLPKDQYSGQPIETLGQIDDAWVVDLSAAVASNPLLDPQESTVGQTVAVASPQRLRVDADYSVWALPTDNLAPVFVEDPIIDAIAGQVYDYTAVAQDPDGVVVEYLLVSGPAGMSVDPVSGQFDWLPSGNDPSKVPVTLRAYDSRGGYGTLDFTILVAGGNQPPQVARASRRDSGP